MKQFIDEHRDVHGVEPICRVLPISPSTYHAHAARMADPQLRCARPKTDEALTAQVQRVWDENFKATVCARSGGNCDANSSTWRDAPCSG